MTFRDALDAHLAAIQRRDLDGLAATLPSDDRIVLVMADGKLVRSAKEFLALHRDWFAARTWTLDAAPISLCESTDLAVAVLKLDYQDTTASGERLHEQSYLTLVFRRDGERWVMVLDQNTPIRAR